MNSNQTTITSQQNRQKYAVITGATSSIGKAFTKKLLRQKYRVGLIARNTPKLKKTINELRKQFPNSVIDSFATDLSQPAEVVTSANAILKSYPKIDALIHTAGIYHYNDKPLYDIALEDYENIVIQDTLNVGITAATLLTKMLLPKMHTGSSIITISGTFSSAKGWLPYFVSKKAIEDFTIGLAQEVKEKGIRVNCISPSDTITQSYKKFFPKYANEQYAIKPNDIAGLFDFLISKKAKYITGQIIEIRK